MTGCQETAGTASQVYLELIGNEGQTGKIDIGDNWKMFQSSDASYSRTRLIRTFLETGFSIFALIV